MLLPIPARLARLTNAAAGRSRTTAGCHSDATRCRRAVVHGAVPHDPGFAASLTPPSAATLVARRSGRRRNALVLFVLVVLVVVIELGLGAGAALAADSEPNDDLGPDLRALIAKERIRQRTGPRGAESRDPRDQRRLDDSQGCGSVDIGNADNSRDARGRSARERMNPREQTVIVTGPVINAARCR